MILFTILFMLDYLLTFYGISQGVIREANPLMEWLFRLPFWTGISVRALLCSAFISAFYLGRKTHIYSFARKGINAIYSLVIILHFSWMSIYFHIF